MHPDFHYKHSLDHQITRVESWVEKYTESAQSLTDSSTRLAKLFRSGIQAARGGVTGNKEIYKRGLLPILYVLKRCYRDAAFFNMAGQSWGMKEDIWKSRASITETHALDTVQEYWALAETTIDKSWVWSRDPEFSAIDKSKEKRIWWWGYAPEFLLQDTNFNDALYKKALKASMPAPYDLSPESRYKEFDETKNYYLSHDSYGHVSSILHTLMVLNKHVEAEECLFRLRHILASGEAPSHIMEAAKIKQIAPGIYFYDHWLRLRLEADPAKRKIEGWTAIYWLLEDYFRNAGTVYFVVKRHFGNLCAIIAEAELWENEKDKVEFMRHLKLIAMNGSIETARKLMDEPTPLVTPKELGFPSTEECRRIYAEVAATVEKSGTNSKPEKSAAKKKGK